MAVSRSASFKSDGPMMEIKMWRPQRQCISQKCLMSHRYPNSPSTEYSRSVATVTYAYSVMGILRGDKQKRNRSHRKSNCKNLKSYGWSSEPNRSQCKLRVQKINSLVFFCYILFFFSSELPLFLFYVTAAWSKFFFSLRKLFFIMQQDLN